MRAKISPRTAMIYVMSEPRKPKSDLLNIPTIIAIAKEKNVPVLVDAAAEEPINPNAHLSQGATLCRLFGRQVPARAAILRHAAGQQGIDARRPISRPRRITIMAGR